MKKYFNIDFYNKLCSVYSHERISNNIETLYNLEKPRGYSAFRDSTEWCRETLEKAGFSDVRRISHKADGETASFDFIMPQAWDLCGRSTTYRPSGLESYNSAPTSCLLESGLAVLPR